ncbi:MAG: hypothetical protein C0594_16365, partial [Marinilabiliales bacterium]
AESSNSGQEVSTPVSNEPSSSDMVSASNISEVKGLLYTIQIGVYKNAVTKEQLMNLNPIYMEPTGTGLTRYFTGIFTNMQDARRSQQNIREAGIRDAFIIAYRDGVRMSISEARRIAENEGNNVFASDQNSNLASVQNEDVNYRIQVGAYKEQVPTNIVSQFLSVAANQGLDQTVMGSTTIYTVGKYNSYEEASTMKSVLINEGIPDAFIVAFKGKNKITIDEAKEILGQ